MFLFKLRAHNYAPFSPNQNPLFRGPVLSGQLLGADPYRPCPFLSLPVITFSRELSCPQQTRQCAVHILCMRILTVPFCTDFSIFVLFHCLFQCNRLVRDQQHTHTKKQILPRNRRVYSQSTAFANFLLYTDALVDLVILAMELGENRGRGQRQKKAVKYGLFSFSGESTE